MTLIITEDQYKTLMLAIGYAIAASSKEGEAKLCEAFIQLGQQIINRPREANASST